MTRTGLSPRLCAHTPEPIVEVHPADAKLAKLVDEGFARVTTESGSAVLKVAIRDGQQRGSIFAPIHWSDATAAHARIGDMVTAATDPFSGQPDLKATPARVEPVEFVYRGFALTRGAVTLPPGTWFARVAVVGGEGLLFASNEPAGFWHAFGRSHMPEGVELTEHVDEVAWCRPGCSIPRRSSGKLFVRRSGAIAAAMGRHAALFEAGELDEDERLALLSERGGDGRRDTGPVICACFGVRLVAIRDAIATGVATDVADIGRTLRAGTNCGSCVPELRGILERSLQPV